MAQQPRRRKSPPLSKTTIRDFGGGLNVIDTEQNLTSRFSPVFDNAIRYADGSVSPRFGYEKWLKLKTGVVTNGTIPAGVNANTTNNSRVLRFTWTAHGFTSGQHITLSGFAAINGIPATDINDTFSVLVIDANTFDVYVPTKATATGASSAAGKAYTKDTHAIGGRIVRVLYFNDYIIVVTSAGEILRVAMNRAVQLLWNYPIANALGGTPPPWAHTDIVAFDYWSGQVILDNGVDKPLRIDFEKPAKVDYLVDPGNSNSNAAIPSFNACKSAFRYFIVHDVDNSTEDRRTVARITAKNTAVVFATSPSPGDAVDVDVSKMLASPNSYIVGFAVIKNNLMVIMPTSTVLLQLGNYVTPAGATVSLHEPIPADTMPNFGTSAPNSIVEIGNDVFMLDYNGVPSARLSSLQNAIVPERVSQLVEPMMAKHIGRLTPQTMRRKAFGVYDPKNKGVQFVLPKYDETDVRPLVLNPFYYNQQNVGTNTFYAYIESHQLEIGDRVRLSGATAFGQLTAPMLNTEHGVVGIVSEDVVVLDFSGSALTETDVQQGGGAFATLQPINDGSIVYLYHYVPSLKINSWSRFKTRTLASACSTVDGTLFMADDDSLYRYGSLTDPVYGDDIGDFQKQWANSTAYQVGDLVRDTVDFRTYKCLVAHTSPATGTFAVARQSSSDQWTDYDGEPIEMVWELPWADFNSRQELKMLQKIHIDATGTGQFTVDLFVDNIYNNDPLGKLVPARSIRFTSGDSPGYGGGEQPFGGGRRTREQFLWDIPIRFKLLKLRITSADTKPIRINAISFLYQRGGIVRA